MREPPYSFCEAQEIDFAGIEELFEPDGRRRGWATWKYLRNPEGLARVFVAKDSTNRVVGSLAHVPRRFTSVSTGALTVLQVVDIFVKPEIRQQAVFLGLLQYARQRVNGPRIGFPNSNSRVFGSGLGWRPLSPLYDWQLPVLFGQILVRKNFAAVASTANFLSRIYTSALLPRDRRVEMKRIPRFSRDYALDTKAIHGVRTAEYLNWRFLDNPTSIYHAYEFFESGESIGYCVYARAHASIGLFDFIATRSRRNCLRLLVDHCREKAVDRVQFTGTGLKLADLGFIRRSLASSTCLGFQLPEGQWLLTPCDLDLEPSGAH